MDEAAAATFERDTESDYQAAQQLLVHPPCVQQQKVQILLFSLLAFAGATVLQGTAGSVIDLAMLIGVILFHEVGHMIAMQLFGYRDVKIFFIPFFGGAASGRKRGVARWKEGVVLLCGPIPGIVLGIVLASVADGGHVRMLAIQLLVVNGVNLAPVMPLDGGQLFQLALFSRNRYLELLFLGVTAALLAVVSLFAQLWVLAIVGVFLLAGLPHRKRVLDAAHRLRDRGWPADPAALDDTQRRDLYHSAMDMLPAEWRARWRGKPQPQANVMEQLLERATQRPPSSNATVGLLAGWLVALVAVGFGVMQLARIEWRPYANEDARFAIELPAPVGVPIEQEGWKILPVVIGDDELTVMWNEQQDDPVAWMTATADHHVESANAIVLISTPNERRLLYRDGDTHVLMRLMVHGTRAYMVGAFTKDDHDSGARFVASFRYLGDPLPR